MKRLVNWCRRHPVLVSNGAALTLTAASTVALWYGVSRTWSLVPWLLAWLVAINVVAVLVFAVDKLSARREAWRIPEATLFTLAFLGGSAGAYAAMRLFRHKTVKGPFRVMFWLIVALQCALVLWLAKSLWTQE